MVLKRNLTFLQSGNMTPVFWLGYKSSAIICRIAEFAASISAIYWGNNRNITYIMVGIYLRIGTREHATEGFWLGKPGATENLDMEGRRKI
jgi:hypothetical protein